MVHELCSIVEVCISENAVFHVGPKGDRGVDDLENGNAAHLDSCKLLNSRKQADSQVHT